MVVVGLTVANQQALDIVKKKDGRILQFVAGYPVPELNVDSNIIHYRRPELIGMLGADYQDFEDAAKMLN